jgi:diadenosine tetraphosphate (Ap4A) HIT family hydrolase
MEWHTGQVDTADHLTDIKKEGQLVYEDEKLLVMMSKNPQTKGHVVIYYQEPLKAEELDEMSSFHLWSCASLCATAVYEGLGAAGSNIILKTGLSDDNEEGLFSVEVLARYEDDGIDVLGEPGEGKDLDAVAAKIKDKMFLIEQMGKEEKSIPSINMDEERKVVTENHDLIKAEVEFNDAEQEIKAALKDITGE